ncbi:hypothetical protein WA026_010852 [Henosepilachna vigintioctopunctata]|uniref:Cytochrome P450 n=1 Tax=Henosepilachna vigintioctopunctata TaxID=420089 RepID=A0AAW1UP72_9CUCU
MFWFLVLIVFIMAYHLYTIKYFKYWERKGVKQKSTYPPFGDAADTLIKGYPFSEAVMRIYNRFPNSRYTGFYQFSIAVLMLRDPDLIKQMYVKDYEHFLDHTQILSTDIDPMWNKNLFSLKGQKWKEMRSTLSPSFTSSKIRQMFVLMDKCAEYFMSNMTQTCEDLMEMDLKDVFTRYANDIIATTAFGIQIDSMKERDNEFYIRGRQTSDFTGFWKHIRLTLSVFIPPVGKIIKGAIFDDKVSTFFRKIIKQTLEYRQTHNIDRPDMLNLLMNARKEKEETKIKENSYSAVEEQLESKLFQKTKMDLSLEDITSQALFFFFAGFETVSSTLCFMAYELATNPDVQRTLIEEFDEFKSKNEEVTYEGLSKLRYFDMVLSETLRKWPVMNILERKCNKPYIIQPKFIDETPVHLTTDNSVWVPIWALHHDPKYWKMPEKFDPQRFSSENKEKIVPYTYMPFGVGPRNCIGSRFAIIEIKVIIYRLLTNFEIVPIKRSVIPIELNRNSFILNAKNGFWFGLKKRKASNNL